MRQDLAPDGMSLECTVRDAGNHARAEELRRVASRSQRGVALDPPWCRVHDPRHCHDAYDAALWGIHTCVSAVRTG
jgi:hypothetical protein